MSQPCFDNDLRLACIAAGAVWLAKALFVVLVPLRALAMTPWLIDDSFILATVARNIALGRGISFDGVEPTSGVSLLWAILTSFNHLALNPEWAMKASIMQSALFGVFASLIVFAIARRHLGREAAWMTFVFTLLSAPAFFNGLNGMETTLAACLALLALARLLALETIQGVEGRPGGELRSHIGAGALLGLGILLRADLAILVFCLAASWLFVSDRAALRTRLTRAAYLGLGALPFAIALIAWCHYADGTLSPANQIGRRFLWWDGLAGEDGVISRTERLHGYARNGRAIWTLFNALLGSSAVMLTLVLAGILRIGRSPTLRGAVLYVAGFAAMLVFYQGYFPDVHGMRYLHLPAMLLAALAFGILTSGLGKAVPRTPLRTLVLGAVLGALLLGSALQYGAMIHSLTWTRGMRIVPLYSAEETEDWSAFLAWAEEGLPAGAAIAAKDHGRLAYFTQARVIDLAGILDPSLIGAVRGGRVAERLREQGMQYALLPTSGGNRVHRMLREEFDLSPVAGVPPQECTNGLLFRVAP